MIRGLKLFLLFGFFFASCNYLMTKEQYIKKYESFMEDIKLHYQNYTEEDWKKKDAEFEKFDVELYNRFKDKLTTSEQARLLRFDFVYNLVRGNINLASLLSGKYNDVIASSMEEVVTVVKEVALMNKDIREILSVDLLSRLIK